MIDRILELLPRIDVKYVTGAVRIGVLLLVGIPAVLFVSKLLQRIAKKRVSEQWGMIAQKAVFYAGTVLILMTVFHEMGFNITAVLGAAGVAGVAIGFASQTSLSNIISGLFLIWEKPFAVGDLVRTGNTFGTVISIDLLSVKICTLDNLYVRVPNETMLKQDVTNITRYPVRRMDINLGVAYKEDMGRVMALLKDIAAKNPYCLDDPEPLLLFKDFGQSALEILYGLWFKKADYLNLRNSVLQEIHERFNKEGIEIPFPHVTLYTGAATDPFPVKSVNPEKNLKK
jgi:small-conductance mechanosensitive channel